MEFLERRIGCTDGAVEDESAQGRSEQIPDDGNGREPGKHLPLFRSRDIRDNRHGNRTVYSRCEPVNEPDDDQGIVAMHPEVREGHKGEEEEPDKHGPLSAYDVRKRTSGKLEEYPGHGRYADSETDGLRSCAEVKGEERKHRASRQGIGRPGKEAYSAECGER